MACGLVRQPESVSIGGFDGGSILFRVDCANAVCDDYSALDSFARLYSAAVTLEDQVPPRAENIAGSLTSGQPLWGSAELTYHATDIGGGVYRHRLVVDGKTVLEDVAASNDGRCRDVMPGWGSAYEFDYILPCALKVDGRMTVDLNVVGAGHHQLEASIEDASGNRRTIYEGAIDVLSDPARRVFDTQGVVGLVNPLGDRAGSVPNGAGAGPVASVSAYVRQPGGKHGTRSIATYPHAPTVVGRVMNGSAPVVGATVAVLEREARSTVWRAVGSLVTSRTGSVIHTPAAGPSRAVRFAYFASSETVSPVSSADMSVLVRPRIVLKPTPRTLRTGRRVRFAGQVIGIQPATMGAMVTLQAGVAGSKWITFKVLRTAVDGRFHAAYRFTNTTGRVRYRFRAVVPRQSGHPFERGTSPATWVRVSG